MHEFDRLQRLDVREGWRHEDADFTPWLGEAENLELLGEVVGMNLELVAREHRVGPYRADLLCRDTDGESMVVIENQFGASDHRHLGQLLTYAAGLQASTVIWVAPEFTDEHQAAINWLNEHTGDDVRFFALEIELWRIGDSAMAPKFNVAAKPNEWVKAGTCVRQKDLSPTKIAQKAYWDAFKEFAAQRGSNLFLNSRTYPQAWIVCRPFARSGTHVAAAVDAGARSLRAEVFFRDSRAKAIFDHLEGHRPAIESQLGGDLIWDRQDDRKASRIKCELDEADWTDDADRERQFDWMLARSEALVTSFKPLIDEWYATHG